MNMKAQLGASSRENHLDGSLTVVNARLKKLRRERYLVERAIMALTEISRNRLSRDRRPARS